MCRVSEGWRWLVFVARVEYRCLQFWSSLWMGCLYWKRIRWFIEWESSERFKNSWSMCCWCIEARFWHQFLIYEDRSVSCFVRFAYKVWEGLGCAATRSKLYECYELWVAIATLHSEEKIFEYDYYLCLQRLCFIHINSFIPLLFMTCFGLIISKKSGRPVIDLLKGWFRE